MTFVTGEIRSRILTSGHRVRYDPLNPNKGIYWIKHHAIFRKFRILNIFNFKLVWVGKVQRGDNTN